MVFYDNLCNEHDHVAKLILSANELRAKGLQLLAVCPQPDLMSQYAAQTTIDTLCTHDNDGPFPTALDGFTGVAALVNLTIQSELVPCGYLAHHAPSGWAMMYSKDMVELAGRKPKLRIENAVNSLFEKLGIDISDGRKRIAMVVGNLNEVELQALRTRFHRIVLA